MVQQSGEDLFRVLFKNIICEFNESIKKYDYVVRTTPFLAMLKSTERPKGGADRSWVDMGSEAETKIPKAESGSPTSYKIQYQGFSIGFFFPPPVLSVFQPWRRNETRRAMVPFAWISPSPPFRMFSKVHVALLVFIHVEIVLSSAVLTLFGRGVESRLKKIKEVLIIPLFSLICCSLCLTIYVLYAAMDTSESGASKLDSSALNRSVSKKLSNSYLFIFIFCSYLLPQMPLFLWLAKGLSGLILFSSILLFILLLIVSILIELYHNSNLNNFCSFVLWSLLLVNIHVLLFPTLVFGSQIFEQVKV